MAEFVTSDEACLVRRCPTQHTRLIIDHNDAMYMIWHDDERIKFDVEVMIGQGIPHPIRDFAHR